MGDEGGFCTREEVLTSPLMNIAAWSDTKNGFVQRLNIASGLDKMKQPASPVQRG